MDVVFTRCAGLDVHKKSITACRMVPDPTGQEAEGIMELRTFGTMTRDLLGLADWLTAASITHVAMESTGEYTPPGLVPMVRGTVGSRWPRRWADAQDAPAVRRRHVDPLEPAPADRPARGHSRRLPPPGPRGGQGCAASHP